MNHFIQNSLLSVQALIYFVIWFLYGYGSEAFNHRDEQQMAKKLFDLAGNEIPLGASLVDQVMGFVGFALIMPLAWISAVYLMLTNIFPTLPSPATKNAFIPFLFALVCLPLGAALVNGGSFYSRFNSTPPSTIQKLRESLKTGPESACALVSYDPDASREEMELCMTNIERTANLQDRRPIIDRFFRQGYVKKFFTKEKSISVLDAIIEGARDNWLALKYFGSDPFYSLEAGLREMAFLQRRSGGALSSVPIHTQIWFIDTYTDILLQGERPLSTMTDIARFIISMQTGWSEEANSHFKTAVLPKLTHKFDILLEKMRNADSTEFTDSSRSYLKRTTDHLHKIMVRLGTPP